MRGGFAVVLWAVIGVAAAAGGLARAQPTGPPAGDQHREYVFPPTGETLPYRLYVPTAWDGDAALPILLFLHGAGADENTYVDMSDGLLRRLAEEHGYILVSPLGFRPLGAYGNPLRLPAVFGESEAAAEQRAAVGPERRRELALSELDVITVLDIVTETYGADRSRTFLAGHSMGSGGVWHLAARYPERWRAVAPMSGPFIDAETYPFDLIRDLPIFMTEGTGAEPSLAGSRALAAFMREGDFDFEYLEVAGDHGGMVPMVMPAMFEFFDAVSARGEQLSARSGAAFDTAPAIDTAPARFVGEPSGTGPFPATAEVRAELPGHTVYRPVNWPGEPLPLYVWGNGGCSSNGLAHAAYLRQVASQGYVVVALGVPGGGPPAPADGSRDATEASQMLEAIDWAERETANEGGDFERRIDVSRIAVGGHSCGGLQALAVSDDPRVDTTLVLNSGIYITPGSGRSRVGIDKSQLPRLHEPVLYLTGGPSDIAHENALDDVARID
ncbi:MAG: hypothetical protein JXB36_07745, partial [Gammaproteobacteria bacterium]|nr:hypothetical protein [Gammaproteobacteria bacterium]